MKQSLVIVESPHKANTIQKYLGKDYKVVASMGHIRDLAVGNEINSLGVDIKNDFAPIYEISPSKYKTVSNLKKLVSSSDQVYLATDPDREGEAISWHLAEVLGLDVKTTKRLEFHEVTYHAIKEAMENPRHIDMDLVQSQETRRILDRILGFKLSQLLQKKIGSKSAGRVQSVVLKLIVDRQKEIDEFVEKTYYRIVGNVNVDGFEVPVTCVDSDKKDIHFETMEEATKVIEEMKNSMIAVKDIQSEIKTRSSKPVYTTSTMQQEASIYLKYDSKKTMKIAQTLYEGVDLGNGEVGLITYMRTDSVRVTPAFINKTKEYISQTYGEDYVGVAKVFNKNADKVQDAHEGIRVTDLSITPAMVEEKASKEQARLYKLIYNRAVASMMKDERYERTEVLFSSANNFLLAVGEKRLFDGFIKALGEFDKVERIPFKGEIALTSTVKVSKMNAKEGKTKGPVPYTEATLISTMEKDGIGRPSTYATTLDIIKTRQYVTINKSVYEPTKQGIVTVEKLEESFADIINIEYTANMETKLDEIATGQYTRSEALKDFYGKFIDLYKTARIEMQELTPQKDDLGKCPHCGKDLVKRNSRFGSFVACSGYPECKFIFNDSKVGHQCPKCHEGKLVLRKSKYGQFYACSCYPKCDYHEKK